MKVEATKGGPCVRQLLDEFVEGHVAALDRYAYALTGDRHAADDLVQETLVRVAGAWRRNRRDAIRADTRRR